MSDAAATTDTWFHSASANPVISARVVTVADAFTRYATPISLDRTVAPAALRTDCADIDGVGAVSSTVTNDEEFVDKLPASSNKNARYEPSTRPDNGNEVEVLAEVMTTDVQRFAFAPVMLDTALTVTVDFTRYTAPVSVADTVALAELLARTLVNVGAVATRSIVTVEATASEAGPLLPDTSLTPLAANVRLTVPSVHELTDTVIEVPVDADGVNTQFVAVPVFEKSDDMRPLILSLNVSV